MISVKWLLRGQVINVNPYGRRAASHGLLTWATDVTDSLSDYVLCPAHHTVLDRAYIAHELFCEIKS